MELVRHDVKVQTICACGINQRVGLLIFIGVMCLYDHPNIVVKCILENDELAVNDRDILKSDWGVFWHIDILIPVRKGINSFITALYQHGNNTFSHVNNHGGRWHHGQATNFVVFSLNMCVCILWFCNDICIVQRSDNFISPVQQTISDVVRWCRNHELNHFRWQSNCSLKSTTNPYVVTNGAYICIYIIHMLMCWKHRGKGYIMVQICGSERSALSVHRSESRMQNFTYYDLYLRLP